MIKTPPRIPDVRAIRALCLLLPSFLAVSAGAQSNDPAQLTVERIYASPEFNGGFVGPLRWLDDGTYTVVDATSGGGNALLQVHAGSLSRPTLRRCGVPTLAGTSGC